MARPERFELPTTKFVAWYSIQLSYGRNESKSEPRIIRCRSKHVNDSMAEREGFEPSIRLLTLYSLSRGAPSASRASLRVCGAAAGSARITADRLEVKP